MAAGNAATARTLGSFPNCCGGSAARFYQRLSDYQQRIAKELLDRLLVLRSVSNPRAARAGRPAAQPGAAVRGPARPLPAENLRQGGHLGPAARERFVGDVRRVDAEATGNPLQVYEASKHMKHSYEQAAVYAFIAIVIVLLVEFRDLHYLLMAMLPLVVGAVQMFGIMGLLDIPLNSANLIVLPLIIGLGVENGIHIVNDFRRRPAVTTAWHRHDHRRGHQFADHDGWICGLDGRQHQGLQSLGRVLTIGMSCCLLSAGAAEPATLCIRPAPSRRVRTWRPKRAARSCGRGRSRPASRRAGNRRHAVNAGAGDGPAETTFNESRAGWYGPSPRIQ